MKDWQVSTALASLGMLLIAASAQAADDMNPKDLVNLSLAELSNIEVTSVSKKSEKEIDAAAAIYVITQDDIKHSGMTSIPELLRMVPGLDVAQSGAHEWAITSRGSNGQFSNKLLVLIDGRAVYTPLFSGVYWDIQDTPLQDIDRIEVIRGPGATLWGANAVNGVINIITKSAKDTQGGFVSETAGNQINSSTTVREGAKIDDDAYVRVYAKYDDESQFRNMQDNGAHDAWNKAQSGFRSDWKEGESQSFTLQGDAYHSGNTGIVGLIQPDASTVSTNVNEIADGGNILGRWDNKFSKDSDLTVQMYYDDAKRSQLLYSDNVQTADFDMQHTWTALQGNEIIWGAGYRLVKSDFQANGATALGVPYIQFAPQSQSDNLFSAFLQDKITLIPNDVFLTLGSKFEHNDFTGFEFQPSARLSWLVDSKQTVWAAISRAVRTPSIGTSDSQLIIAPVGAGPLAVLEQVGSKQTQSEELVAYELGYRVQPAKNMSLDVSTYYNNYNRLLLGMPGAATPETSPLIGTYFIIPISPINAGTAHSYGIETTAKWNPESWVELAGSYTLLEMTFDQPDPLGYDFNNKTPRQQFNARATFKLPYDVEFTTSAYYVDKIAAIDLNTGNDVPAYTRVDARLAWKPLDSLELSLVGQNLLDNAHQEFSGFLYQGSSQVPRTVYGNITWKF